MKPKMKKLLFLLPIVAMFTACDSVDEKDRLIPIEIPQSERKVLLEEFTGQLCTNCPKAHAVIENLEEQYGEDLIVVSIHGGKGSFGIPAPAGLLQEQGDQYSKYWGVSAFPMGMIDRTSGLTTFDNWPSYVVDEIGKTTSLGITLNAQVDPDNNTIQIFSTLGSSEPLKGSYQLWVVENNIVAMQIDGGTVIQDYTHNNVFRACVNGEWGQEVNLEANIEKNLTNTISIDQSWKPENLRIVGFYYNDSGVVQAERCEVEM